MPERPRSVLLCSPIDERSVVRVAALAYGALCELSSGETDYRLFRAPRLRLPFTLDIRLGRRRLSSDAFNTHFAWVGYYPLLAAFQRADVYHILAEPYAAVVHMHDSRRCIVTVNHETPAILRDVLGVRPGPAYTLRSWAFAGVLRAAHVVTSSEFIRRHLLDEYSLRPDRVTCVPYACAPTFRPLPPESRAATRRRHGLPQEAFLALHVGHCGPTKNIETILRALAQLPANFQLVKVGGEFTPAQCALRDALGVSGRVHALGIIPDDAELAALYNAADVLLFPSILEGFGLPLLEAMACGLPAITSNCGAMAEVAGAGALLVDGRQPEALAAGARSLLESEERRRYWREAGLRRAADFSWRRHAEQLAAIYQTVYEETRQ